MTPQRWATLSEKPLSAAALAFLIVYSWQVLGRLQGNRDDLAEVITWLIWTVFLVDYVVRVSLARRRGWWVARHLLDLAIVVLPLLRPLRLLRLVTLLSVFRRAVGTNLRGRVVVYAAGSTVLLLYVASLAMLEAERGRPGAAIQSFGEALWWSCTTITTVGYGDFAPVTFTGRVVAVALMVGGIALLGTVTATIASWLVEQVSDREDAALAPTRAQVTVLTERIDELTALVARLVPADSGVVARPAAAGAPDGSR